MPEDKPETKSAPTAATGEPHTVKAGIFDAFFGAKGPNGEVMYRGKPLMVADVPDTDDEDD